MKSKPNKCITARFRKFDKKIKNKKFKQPMRYIFTPKDPDTFKAEHFMFVGRWIHYQLSEGKTKSKIWDAIIKDFLTADNLLLNRFMKLWIYQFYILAQLSWPFLIYDFDRSFVVNLQRKVNTMLKKWAGIC